VSLSGPLGDSPGRSAVARRPDQRTLVLVLLPLALGSPACLPRRGRSRFWEPSTRRRGPSDPGVTSGPENRGTAPVSVDRAGGAGSGLLRQARSLGLFP
jgi:hypothetical protein